MSRREPSGIPRSAIGFREGICFVRQISVCISALRTNSHKEKGLKSYHRRGRSPGNRASIKLRSIQMLGRSSRQDHTGTSRRNKWPLEGITCPNIAAEAVPRIFQDGDGFRPGLHETRRGETPFHFPSCPVVSEMLARDAGGPPNRSSRRMRLACQGFSVTSHGCSSHDLSNAFT